MSDCIMNNVYNTSLIEMNFIGREKRVLTYQAARQ